MYTKFLTGLTGGAIAGLIFKYFLKKANAESTPAETPTTPVNETLVVRYYQNSYLYRDA